MHIVDAERQKDYGDPVEFFQKLAPVWHEQSLGGITPLVAVRMSIRSNFYASDIATNRTLWTIFPVISK